MPDKCRLALAQLNPTVGDISGNAAKLLAARTSCSQRDVDIILTSELYLCGYPPEDIVLKPSFQHDLAKEINRLARVTADGGPAVLLGTPWREEGLLYNAVLLLADGAIKAAVFKSDLPNYGPFDEKRVFASGLSPTPIAFRGMQLGVLICEDMWTPTAAAHLKGNGAHILLVPNGSPFETGKAHERVTLAKARVLETGLPLVYVNQIGGQDELVFDGASFALNAAGDPVCHMKAWEESIDVVDLSAIHNAPRLPVDVRDPIGDVYNALMLGLRDYVSKNRFSGVVLGLSGGIDSALVAVLAADALGADKLWTVMLPSQFTSEDSFEDAAAIAANLGCRHNTISIEPAMVSFADTLKDTFEGAEPGVTEENIQARIRGVLLMGLSNKFGPMVVSTGNKSEMSVGYSTLYGDLCGGFAVLKDVYKTDVYRLVEWRNGHKPPNALGPSAAVIPDRVSTKAPTAELRPNQKDQDNLPPYDELDAILACLIENDMSSAAVAARGYSKATIERVWQMLDRAEYKRRQAPPGVKITRRLLGKDRRYPITNGYRENS